MASSSSPNSSTASSPSRSTSSETTPRDSRVHRRAIPRLISDRRKRATTRCKRTQGLLKKVSFYQPYRLRVSFYRLCKARGVQPKLLPFLQGLELATMTGAKVAVLVQSEKGTTYAYVSDKDWARRALASAPVENGEAPIPAASVARAGSYQAPS